MIKASYWERILQIIRNNGLITDNDFLLRLKNDNNFFLWFY